VAVTHLFDQHFYFSLGREYHGLIDDYAIHWIDVSGYWLRSKEVDTVRAHTYDMPNQPAEAADPWGGWVEIHYRDGSNVMLRAVGGTATQTTSHPYWIHGTEGTIRGSVLGLDWVEIERQGVFHRCRLEGDWWSVGFASTMGELLYAIAEDREPANSGRDNLRTVALTLAADRSAASGGRPVMLEEIMGAPAAGLKQS
jgi:predicted dehydrogenase